MSIILLRGFSHSGKDFVGDILCKKYNYCRFAFADSLKHTVAKKYGCSLKQLHTQEGKRQICESDIYKRTYRQLLIDNAVYLRSIDSGVFAKQCCQEIYEFALQYPHNKVVITDWRYPNELQIITAVFPKYKITTVHVKRDDQTNSPINDISEYYLTNRNNDFVVINRMDESIYDELQKLILYETSL